MAIKIITESTSDLPREYIDAHACLDVIPMTFRFEDSEQEDVAGKVDNHANYERLRAGGVATTSQLNVDVLYNRFKRHLQAGHDVLYLAFSSGLSGTCSSGLMAASDLRREFPDRQIEVVDTLQASLGEGLLVARAVAELERGCTDMAQLKRYVESERPRVNAWFTVDDLKYLKRGGRISATTAALGTVLSIKPVMHVDDEGHLIPVGKERGRKRALKALVDHMAELCDDKSAPVFIGHGDCPDDARLVADMVYERLGMRTDIVNYIGLVIGAHSGPGTLALFFIGRNRG